MQAININQVPPHSADAEQAVLAGLMHGEWTDDISLNAEDFYIPCHGVLFKACIDLIQASRPVDPPALLDYLRGHDLLEKAGGAETIVSIYDQDALAVQCKYYAGIVRAKSKYRRLIHACICIISNAYNAPWEDVDDIVDNAEQMVFSIAEKTNTIEPNKSIDVADAAINDMEDKYIEPDKYKGIRLGWPSLDDIVLGVPPRSSVLISARPSVGKSAAALNIASSMAANGLHVLFCSLEMTAKDLMDRQIAAMSNVQLTHVVEPDGRLTDDEIDRIYGNSSLLDMPIWYDDTPALSISALRSMARRHKATHGLDVAIVDYLQLMTTDKQHRTEEDRIAYISSSIKALAKDLNIVIISLAQLNRSLEYRDDSTPKASDLRGSGTLEQDADIIIMMHRQFQTVGHGPKLSDIPVIFDVVKNRRGNTGTAVLMYRGQYTRFEDYEPYYKPNIKF